MKTLTPLEEEKSYSNTQVQTNNAPLIHLSALSKYIIPFGSILGPLVTWLIWKDRSKFEDFHGKEALNFNISFILYKILIIVVGLFLFLAPFIATLQQLDNNPEANPIGLIFSIPGFFLFVSGFGILEIIWLILIIVAAVKSGNGEKYKYPLTIHFIK